MAHTDSDLIRKQEWFNPVREVNQDVKFANQPIQNQYQQVVDTETPAIKSAGSQIVDHQTMLALVKCSQMVVRTSSQWMGNTLNRKTARSNRALTELCRASWKMGG